MVRQTSRAGWRLVALLLLAVAAGAAEFPAEPAPRGRAFPLGLFSVPVADLPAVRDLGWQFGHTYGFKAEYLDEAAAAGLFSVGHLHRKVGETDDEAVRQSIVDMAARDSLVWWDLPEEMRWWRAEEWSNVTELPAWTRELDPQRRPNYMYLPNHYTAEALARYVPHLDIIGAGAYTEYARQPRAWVRWRISEQVRAIELAGYKVGCDYLNGERLPIAVLQLFWQPDTMDLISPIEARHDFWSAICAGARGVLLFSYWHKRDGGGALEATWRAYCQEAAKINGPEALGEVILWGEPVTGLTAGVTAGEPLGAPFTPYGSPGEIRLPAVNVRAWRHGDATWLLAVNSNERPVSVVIGGLPAAAGEATVLFEPGEGDQPRRVPLAAGLLSDRLAGLQARWYKLASD